MVSALERVRSVHWKDLYVISKDLAEKSHRTQSDIFLDIVHCYRQRKMTWLNYMTFGFHVNTDPASRDTYVSEYGDNAVLVDSVNNQKSLQVFVDKGVFHERFKAFTKREALDLRTSSKEDFFSMLDRHEVLFIKPVDGFGGKGILRVVTAEIKDREALYGTLLEQKKVVVEEEIRQHPLMNRLSLHSVNTLRVCTCINRTGEVSIPYMVLRTSTSDRYFDNMSQGGMFCRLSDNGVIEYPMYANIPKEMIYEKHPLTGLDFIGFQVPCIAEVKELVTEAAKILPDCRYVGWDVAISEKGPLLVEGNGRPSVDLPQCYIHSRKREGLVRVMEQALDIKLR